MLFRAICGSGDEDGFRLRPMPMLIAQLAQRTAKKVQILWDSIRVGKIVLALVGFHEVPYFDLNVLK